MLAYQTLNRDDLGVTADEWDELVRFTSAIQTSIEEQTTTTQIESAPPRVKTGQSSSQSSFSPGGWVGRYPGSISVYPDPEKLNQFEYRHAVEKIADWITIWDVPIARADLPILQTESLERRRLLLGYSDALVEFTEEAIAHRPPVSISREERVGPEPRGTPDVSSTIQRRAGGSQEIAYQKLNFSLDHPMNLLLLRFHAELRAELGELIEQSIMVKSHLEQNQSYHRQFIETEFPAEVLDTALKTDFSDPAVLDRARRESPDRLAELIEIWESYRRQQTLSVTLERQLNAGLKPVEKVYELWVLSILLEKIEKSTGETPSPVSEDLRQFEFTNDVILHYNRPLRSFSRLLADGLGSSPGRPDYALSVDDRVVWVGDAKYRPASNIDLEDYQRLLSYAVDLMPATDTTATIFYVSDTTRTHRVRSQDYTVEELPLKPKSYPNQEKAVERRVENCIPHDIEII